MKNGRARAVSAVSSGALTRSEIFAIMIGGLGTMAPTQWDEIVGLGLRAVVAGTLATCMTGAVVGLIGCPLFVKALGSCCQDRWHDLPAGFGQPPIVTAKMIASRFRHGNCCASQERRQVAIFHRNGAATGLADLWEGTMRKAVALLFMLVLAGVAGYRLFDGIGIGWVLLAVGSVGALYGLWRRDLSRHGQGSRWDRSMGLKGQGLVSRLPWCQADAVQDAQRNRHLESLLSKAHFLATTCQDSYGARTYCMDIIRQTRPEDPLFVQAFDLYMHTVTTLRRRPPRVMPSGLDVSFPGMRDNVIPFPLNACRN